MDPLGAASRTIHISSLPKWAATPIPDYHSVGDEQKCVPSPFPVRADINRKVVLWNGDLTRLQATAIVNTTNESLSDKGLLSERVHRAAGPELMMECKKQLMGCRTGEAKLSDGYNLPSRYVIHTVGPRYNTKYKTAAESALFSCYRNVLKIVRENKFDTLGLCVVNTPKRGYPPEDGAHIALRTVRRFLEKYTDTIDAIAFVAEGSDESIYRKIMPLYFPRSQAEEDFVLDFLPKDIGNEEGEPIIAERQIRISNNPTFTDDRELDIGDLNIGRHEFAAMQGDHDQMSRQRAQRAPEELHAVERQRIYQRWLRRAHTEDFTSLKQQKVLYTSGVDFLGRHVVVFVGRHFNIKEMELSKCVAYFISVLDRIVNRDYVVVYFHTHSTDDNQPPLSFLKGLYHIVDQRYRRNLKAFYIVHPTLWTRLVTWFFTTFTASSIKDKVHIITGIQYLYDWINPDQLDIPPFVLEYDMKENGTNYHTPSSSYRTGSL